MPIAKIGPVSADPLRLAVTTVVICALACDAGTASGGDYPVLPGAGLPLPAERPAVSSPGAAGPAVDTAHRIAPQTDTAWAPGWTVEPRVNVAAAFNDNILQSSHRTSDFVTYVTPEVSLRAQTRRLQASVDYAPTAEIFASHSGQDAVAQNLRAYGIATLVEDALFLDLRGFAGVTPTTGSVPLGSSGLPTPGFGGFGRSSASVPLYLSKDNQTQSSSFSAAPYFVRRFADAGTLTIADRVAQSRYGALGATPAYVARAGANADLLTNEELAQFVTGSALGRVHDVALADASQFYGNGVTDGAHQTLVINQLGYAVARGVLVFGELGYEDIAYPKAIPGVRIDDAVWAAGATLTPDPDSTVSLGYGHRYGFNAAFLDASYRLTARTRIFARYQTGLGTDLQQLQGLVALSGVDQFGNVVDSQTGAPLFIGNPSLAVQGNGTLNRTKTFVAGASTGLDRDTVSIGLVATDQKAVAGSAQIRGASGIVGTSARAVSGNIVWQHELSEAAQTAIYVGYGTQKQPLGTFAAVQDGSEDFLGTLASYSYRFSPTLSGIAEYGYFQRNSRAPGRSFVQNIALVGVTKQF